MRVTLRHVLDGVANPLAALAICGIVATGLAVAAATVAGQWYLKLIW